MVWLVSRCVVVLFACAALIRPAVAMTSCAESAGPAQARRYVEQCQLVSPVAHALCRTTYSCPLIQDEIRRGCALTGREGPAFCLLYRGPGQAKP